MMIEHVFLDFDGTIMVYDEDPGFFHPQVIETLNGFADRGITWYSNSGRCFEAQQEILACSVGHGLKNMPSAMICSECFVFEKQGDAYVGHDEWNAKAKRTLLEYHKAVQAVVKPFLKEWEKYIPADEIYLQPMATFFQLEEGCDNYYALAQAFAEVIEGVDGGGVVKNGPWIFAQPHTINKGRILEQYLKWHHFDPTTVMAVGDHENDVSMLNGSVTRNVGCPGNAISAVKKTVAQVGGYVSEIVGPLGTLEVLSHYLA